MLRVKTFQNSHRTKLELEIQNFLDNGNLTKEDIVSLSYSIDKIKDHNAVLLFDKR